MTTATELAFTPAAELRKYIAAKQVSPVELTALYLSRIDRLDPQLNSYLLVTHEEAMKSAKAAEDAVVRGDELGPLHGLPIAFKDAQMTKGVRTSVGSAIFRDRVPERNATVVQRVLDAGAIMLGKTNMPEFGLVGTCQNRLGDDGRNPWNTDHTPGGSSSGAAASVAAGLCPVATGSDGGGSIRIPANFCGIYGIKPTQGRVSGYTGLGGHAMPNIFSQVGPLSRTVRDSAILLQTLAGHDPEDPTSLRESPPDFVAAVDQDIKGLRLAWSPDFGFADVEPEVLDVTARAGQVFEELGCYVEEVDLVLDPPYDTFGPLQAADSFARYGTYLESHGDQLTDYSQFFLEIGSRVTAIEYARALGLVDRLKARFADLFEKYDLLLSPTACSPAPVDFEFPGPMSGKTAYPEQYWNGAFTLPINTIGHPAATIPAGFSSDGLPIGLHIVGNKGGEETVIAASAAFERERPWAKHRPPGS